MKLAFIFSTLAFVSAAHAAPATDHVFVVNCQLGSNPINYPENAPMKTVELKDGEEKVVFTGNGYEYRASFQEAVIQTDDGCVYDHIVALRMTKNEKDYVSAVGYMDGKVGLGAQVDLNPPAPSQGFACGAAIDMSWECKK